MWRSVNTDAAGAPKAAAPAPSRVCDPDRMCRNIRPLHNFEPADLVNSAPPKDREVEREKARARNAKRFGEPAAS